MSTLKEFLATRGKELRAEWEDVEENRREWVESVHRLYEQMRGWIKEADPDGYLQVFQEEYTANERNLGEYHLTYMGIHIGSRNVRVEPIARYVASPLSYPGGIQIPRVYGRVDMSDGLSKYLLYRVSKEPEDRWIIVDQDGYRVRDLDQEAFEGALQCLLD